jgi:hypothetical protein
MRIAGKLRIAMFALLAAAVIAARPVRLPVIPLCSRTALYLLAQYKLAVGDNRAAIQLLNRAAETTASPNVRVPACPAPSIHKRT